MTRVQLYCMTQLVQEKVSLKLPSIAIGLGMRQLVLTPSENRIFDLDNPADILLFDRALRIAADHDHVIRIVEA